jgi:hypothetical protein
MILHLGVVDVPYTTSTPQHVRRVAVRTRKGSPARVISAPPAGGQTTGDVAEILEDKYRVMGNFFDAHETDIAGALEETIGDAFENLLSGINPGSNATAAAMGQIETLFHTFISTQEMDGMGIPGVPTQAALNGVNHRLAHPTAKSNPSRPSFRDTGLFDANFKAWIEE